MRPENGNKGPPPHPKNASTLNFTVPRKRPPLYYGQCTVYVDMKRKAWRLKLFPGDRHDLTFIWKNDPKRKWAELVHCIKKVNS